jgi:hypothetical protein
MCEHKVKENSMEMPTSPEELAKLPEGEQRFVSLIVNGNFAAYGVGFSAEQATVLSLRNHHRQFNQFSNIALLRVGSGGRFEGSGLGETEFVLLTTDSSEYQGLVCKEIDGLDEDELKRDYPPTFFETLKEVAGTDILHVGLTAYMKVSLEHKRVDGDEKLSYYPGNTTPFPGRVIEGEFIAGNPSLVTVARRKVFDEVANDPKILAGLKEDLKVYRKVCESGLSRKVQQFDLDTGELFFNPENKQFGLKYGVLRYVQSALSIEFFELFQRRKMSIDEYIDLPPSVEERIRYAFRKGWVANEEDMIIAGHIYIQAMDVQTATKVNFYSEGGKRIFGVVGGLRTIHEDVVKIFETRLLID